MNGAVGDAIPLKVGTEMKGRFSFSSNASNGQAVSKQKIVLEVRVDKTVGSSTTSELGPGIYNPAAVLGPVRCDNGVGLYAEPLTPGCVLTETTPTFTLNPDPTAKSYAPLHAAFVARAQASGAPGAPGSNLPLHREANKEARKGNRSDACRGFVPTTPKGTPRAQVDSCDEYPYAGTKESGPGVTQIGHVPNSDNGNAGSQYSAFLRNNRILDGDPFYVNPNTKP